MIELLAIDIDNTITDENGVIGSSVILALRDAERCGKKIALVSARPPQGVLLAASALGVSAYRIGYLGAVIQEPSGQELQRLTIDADIARDIACWADDAQISLTLTIDDIEYHTLGALRPSMIPSRAVATAVEALDGGAAPVLIGTVGDTWSWALAKYCNSKFSQAVYLVRHVNINGAYLSTLIVNRRADKGTALIALCQHLAIAMPQVLAIGDSESDVAMFRVAGYSVAVQNSDVSARNAATFVASASYGEGVAWAISKFITD
jgi:hydroxymethylpyrimidine pyrophosphatase-like HAD family hydrolase